MPAIDANPVLRSMVDHGCRFVVIGSLARHLCGDDVSPADLDLVVEDATHQRPRLVATLTDLDGTIARRGGVRSIEETLALPWRWGWRTETRWGSIDVITRLIDGTDFEHHDADAVDVTLASDLTIRCHPTEHLE